MPPSFPRSPDAKASSSALSAVRLASWMLPARNDPSTHPRQNRERSTFAPRLSEAVTLRSKYEMPSRDRFNRAKAQPVAKYAVGRQRSTVFVSQSSRARSSHGSACANSPFARKGNARPVYAPCLSWRIIGRIGSLNCAVGIVKSPLELADRAEAPHDAVAAQDVRGTGRHAKTSSRQLSVRSLQVACEDLNGLAILAPPVMSYTQHVVAEDPQLAIMGGCRDLEALTAIPDGLRVLGVQPSVRTHSERDTP